MKTMSSSPVEPNDLLDLKLLPAWVKEPAEARNYEHYTGQERERPRDGPRPPHDKRDRKFKRSTPKGFAGKATNAPRSMVNARKPHSHEAEKPGRDRPPRARRPKHREEDRHSRDRRSPVTPMPLEIMIRFLPSSRVFENVVAQIKSGSVAYSIFALAGLFLEKPERYEVRLTAKAELPLYRLGENGAVSLDREFLDRNAFRLVHEDFYKIDITQSDPIKGNFSNVARCRLSGTLLGPTNHHNYQPQLRSLYEQRFSRRMSFADYQRQIEIVNDPALTERWKEEARTVTTYATLHEENPLTFPSAAEAERHFRSNYLPGLVSGVEEATIGGILSRRLPDRTLNRAIEDAWARETRSPSNIMQELGGRFRQAGLNVFRHRRGMLFVSPIRVRPFVHEHAGVSSSVNTILEALTATPGINRKEIFEKVIADSATEDAEARKLALASDLRWLINEGYVIEFNDGSLDLPRGKAKPPKVVAAVASTAESTEQALAAASASTPATGDKTPDELVGVEAPSS
jgi:hypothetical protein